MNKGISQASVYRNNSHFQWEVALNSLNEFHFDPRDHVLDVGCRDGRISAFISDLVPEGKVVGLDISEHMISEANSQFTKANLSFLQVNTEEIPFAAQFDKLIALNYLHWIPDQKKALISMRDSLKPEGSMLLLFPIKSKDIVLSLVHSDKWKDHFPFFKPTRFYHTPEEFAEILKECNLKTVNSKVFEVASHYQNKEALIRWLRPLINCIDHLQEHIQKEFVEDVANELILLNATSFDENVTIRINMMQIIAKKN